MKLLFLLFLVSCSMPSQQLSTTSLYKKDVTFWVNDRQYVGVGVVPHGTKYKMYFEFPKGNIDLITLTTCHRSVQVEDKDHGYNYTFTPNILEKESACPLDVGIYDKKGRHGWGYLLFEKPENNLLATLECNGENIQANGVSICQGRMGTLQRINFKGETNGVAADGCEFTKVGNSFEYEMAKGFCYYSFSDGAGNIHDHTTYGYETFIIRE
ncbi:hypothetical protein [Caudoviricetes sp.]|nr:hypothetical protein [Caudoviricetes sp.]